MPPRPVTRIVALALAVLIRIAPAEPPSIKVFVLAGQSNMEGQGVADLDGEASNDGKGTLRALLRDPTKADRFRHLTDDAGRWRSRDDVRVWFQPGDGPLRIGPLTGTADGGLTIDDLLYYLSIYADGSPRADIDDGSATGTVDGGVTIDDLLYFIVRYATGC